MQDKLNAPASPSRSRRGTDHLRRFARDEHGGLIVFSLFILLCMFMAIGLAIDTIRFEHMRARLQNTVDASVLAAADLDQSLDPTAVVQDFFDKAELGEYLVDVSSPPSINSKTVSAEASADLKTMFMDMVGIDTLAVPAAGTANETLSDIEIALVLDNSGSMGQNGNLRLNLLKPAAKDFIDTVVRSDTENGSTTVSIIPFATQVAVGAELLSHYNVSNEHDYSHCVTFETSDFETASLSTATPLQRTGHFDRSSNSWSPQDSSLICPQWDSRKITPWSNDKDLLKNRIEAMQAAGWTSIEIGTKWGLTMLNPTSSSVLDAMITAGAVDAELSGQPFAFGRDNTMKVLVVMSDGENTNNYDLKSAYRSGDSPLYVYVKDGQKRYSYYHNRSGTSRDYYRLSSGSWKSSPDGGNSATQMTWPEVWADMSVKKFTHDIKEVAIGGNGNTYFNEIVSGTGSGTKNTRTSKICKAARDAGVTIFTIGMDTYGQGDTTLADCASSITHFYDVRSLDISTAFAAIARQINQLRLTH